VFLTFYILHPVPPKYRGAGVTYPPTLPLNGPGCTNDALIDALKNLKQCVNVLKNNTLTALYVNDL